VEAVEPVRPADAKAMVVVPVVGATG